METYLKEAYEATIKMYQFITSDLAFDAKIDYIETALEKRAKLFELISKSEETKPDDYRPKIKQIVDYDEKIKAKMVHILEEQTDLLDEIKSQKRRASKINHAQKKYLNPQSQSGYFINHKK